MNRKRKTNILIQDNPNKQKIKWDCRFISFCVVSKDSFINFVCSAWSSFLWDSTFACWSWICRIISSSFWFSSSFLLRYRFSVFFKAVLKVSITSWFMGWRRLSRILIIGFEKELSFSISLPKSGFQNMSSAHCSNPGGIECALNKFSRSSMLLFR